MSAEEPLYIATCHRCGQRMKVPEKAIGKSYKCVKCGEHLSLNRESLVPLGQDISATGEKPAEVIGQLLLSEGLVAAGQLAEVLQQQQVSGGRLIEIMIAMGHLNKDALHGFISKQSGVATIELSRMQIDQEVVKSIPKEMALECLVLPIDKLGKLLTVAMVCPLDMVTIAEIEQMTELRVKAVLCHYDDIQIAVQHYYQDQQESAARQTFQLPTAMVKEKRLDLGDKINQVNDLSVPSVYLDNLEKLIQDDATSPQDLVLTIGSSPVLTAYVLRMANSPAFAMPGDVDSLALALTLIDVSGLKHVIEQCREQQKSNGQPAAWLEQARRASMLSSLIAKEIQGVGRSVAHTMGILAELGRFILLELAPADYSAIEEDLHGHELLDKERRLLAVTHSESAAALAVRWRFPDAISDALKFSHQPSQAKGHETLAALTGLIPSLIQDPAGADLSGFKEHFKLLGISETKVREIAQQVG